MQRLSRAIIALVTCLAGLTWAMPGAIAANCLAFKPAVPAIPLVRDKWAVVVGISQFQDPGIVRLRFGTKNAVDLGRVLKDSNIGHFAVDHVSVLTGLHATKNGIETTLVDDWLVKKALPNDLVLVYFATRIVPAGQDVLLCTYDTLASEADKSGISLTAFLTDLRRRTQSHRILCVLDTAPVNVTTENVTDNLLEQISRSTNVSLLSANKLFEPSYDAVSNSYFTEYLIEGLKAGGGGLPLSMVAQYVAQNVHDEVQKTVKKNQIPILAIAPDSDEISRIPLGIVVKSSLPPPKIHIGHPMNQLPLTRPDLAQRQPRHEAEENDDDSDSAGQDIDFSGYLVQMKQAIQKQWIPPKGIENRTVVTLFSILRDGSIVNDSVVESSGVESIDKAAIEALHAASPLPQLPPGAPKSVQIRYKFDWRVSRGNSAAAH